MERILIVDDDPEICRLMDRFLTMEGYAVLTAGSGAEMSQILARESVDLVILDLLLPDGDGFSLARNLRSTSLVPLIILTGKSDTVDKVVGLELGADDYITKPFDRRELLARIRTNLRRSRNSPTPVKEPAEPGSIARFLGWDLHFGRRELTSPTGERVYLTHQEFELLSVLVQRPQRAISRDQILDYIASGDREPFDRTIDVTIGKIRRKLNDNAKDPMIIKTLRSVGYLFIPNVERI
ncbi:MAG: response regulator transcription factor [Alphaproteobacteria bacterium]|nr:response regulator transcription factor [Alphaproteobacteria bacterium]